MIDDRTVWIIDGVILLIYTIFCIVWAYWVIPKGEAYVKERRAMEKRE